MTLECPDQVLDVPVQLRPEVDLVESASDADVTALEEHETPTKEKLQPGHRDHAAFRKVRSMVMVSDLVCALVVLGVVLSDSFGLNFRQGLGSSRRLAAGGAHLQCP